MASRGIAHGLGPPAAVDRLRDALAYNRPTLDSDERMFFSLACWLVTCRTSNTPCGKCDSTRRAIFVRLCGGIVAPQNGQNPT